MIRGGASSNLGRDPGEKTKHFSHVFSFNIVLKYDTSI